MSFLNSLQNKSKKFDDPFLHWELDKPLTDQQINEIVKSNVNIVVYVSCNFKTFERDAKVLLSNDLMIDWIKPIDQFPYTNHLEIVAKFVKIR